MNLGGVNMIGQLPSSFAVFVGLTYLDLSGNGNLNGTIPVNMLTSFTYLAYLYVGGTQLSGMLSGAGGACTPNLQYLDIATGGGTQLSGFDLSQCKGLTSISIGFGLNGRFANFPISSSSSPCSFPYLTYVQMNGVLMLQTSFNLTCFCSSTNLAYMDISGNALPGAIPSCISTLPKLQTFIAQENAFTGITFSGNYPNLNILDVSNNKIVQDFSTLHFPALVKGIFDYNQFYGAPYLNIGPLVEVLSMRNNNFVGDFSNPSVVPQYLQAVDMRGNSKMLYTNIYFSPNRSVMTGDIVSGTVHSYTLCSALSNFQPPQPQYQIVILVSPSYYAGTPYEKGSCIVLNY